MVAVVMEAGPASLSLLSQLTLSSIESAMIHKRIFFYFFFYAK